jgi:hypothetical protein
VPRSVPQLRSVDLKGECESGAGGDTTNTSARCVAITTIILEMDTQELYRGESELVVDSLNEVLKGSPGVVFV